jgi:ribosomal protein S18 acetylase RimI-like enzyme
MASGPQFRVAQPSDAETILDLMHALYEFDGYGYDREKARTALIPLLENSEFGRAWIVLDDDFAVGYVVLCFGYSLEWLGRDAFVDEIYLRKEYRGRGWGKKTMVFIEDAARDLGIRVLHLGVAEGNNTALRLYEAIGFSKHRATFLSKWIAKDASKPEPRSPNRSP